MGSQRFFRRIGGQTMSAMELDQQIVFVGNFKFERSWVNNEKVMAKQKFCRFLSTTHETNVFHFRAYVSK